MELLEEDGALYPPLPAVMGLADLASSFGFNLDDEVMLVYCCNDELFACLPASAAASEVVGEVDAADTTAEYIDP